MGKEKFLINIFILIIIIKHVTSETAFILMDHLFSQLNITMPKCLRKEVQIPSNRGKIENFDKIIKEDKKDLYNNPFIYIHGKDNMKYIQYFSEKTIFFTDFEISWDDIKSGICYIQFDKWYEYNYIIMSPSKLSYIILPICCLFFAYSIPIAIFKLYKSELKRLVLFKKIHFYKFAQRMVLFWIAIIISAVIIYFFLLSYVIYSLYKSYLIINLLLLLDGFSIIHFNKSLFKFKKYFIIFFLYDSLISIYSEYIVYFIPYFDNFYFLHIKSLFEHCIFLIMIIRFIFKRYIHMKKQQLLATII